MSKTPRKIGGLKNGQKMVWQTVFKLHGWCRDGLWDHLPAVASLTQWSEGPFCADTHQHQMRASLPIVPAQLPALQGYAALSGRHTTCIGAESPIRAFVHPSQFVDNNSMFILHVFKDLRLLWARAQLQPSATCWSWWAQVYLCLRFGLLCRIWFA